MNKASIIHPLETSRAVAYRRLLSALLGSNVHLEQNDDTTSSDGVITLEYKGVRIQLLIMELKREFGESESDATNQAAIFMKRYWLQEQASFDVI